MAHREGTVRQDRLRKPCLIQSQFMFTRVSNFLLTVLLSGAVFSSVSCSWRSPAQPSVLVILVENLGFGTFSCQEPTNQDDEGFDAFCQESVRFTHAYAPSTMTQPNVVSILTGMYPTEHGVRHNGAQALSAKAVTVAEAAKTKGYKTSFFSGGPPVWRRAGISQGFDTFDDNISVSIKSPYRPSSAIVDAFLNWQANRAPNGKFVGVLSFADAQFVAEPTSDQLGELREVSYRGQLAEISESLAHLVRELKARKLWDSTQVVLVGFGNGPDPSLPRDPQVISLLSESTHATLMIKAPRKNKEGPYNWKIDSNVSLSDVGMTLYDLVGAPYPARKSSYEVASLKNALSEPTSNWATDRLIVSESAWAEWRGVGSVRAAGRRGPYLYIFDHHDQLYNTLSDSLEISPLPIYEQGNGALRDSFVMALEAHGYQPWPGLPPNIIARIELGSDLWSRETPPEEPASRLIALSKRYPTDSVLRGWRAIVALKNSDWAELKAAAGQDKPIWSNVAAANMGEKVAWGKLNKDPAARCFISLLSRTNQVAPECEDDLTRAALIWTNEAQPQELRRIAENDFFRMYAAKSLLEKVARANAVAGDRWDVASGALKEPALVDLLMAWPTLKKYRASLLKRQGAERK